MPPLTDGSSSNDEAPLPEEPVPGSPEDGAVENGAVENGRLDDEPTATGAPELPAAPETPRRHPSTIGGAIYLLVLGTTLVGLVIVSTGRWRTGVHWMAGALVVAAVVRAVLPGRDAGMLAVRSRWFDAGLLAGIGVVLWFLATSIPAAS